MKTFEIDFRTTKACIYRGEVGQFGGYLRPITALDRTSLESFVGIDEPIALLKTNTQNLLCERPYSHALFWGARGCGKTSSMRAILGSFLHDSETNLRVIEIDKQDLSILPFILDFIRDLPYKFVLFCDDLSFNRDDESYKPLKRILDGGFEKVADNVAFYATSNLRHLLLEEYVQDTSQIHQNDICDEIVSLSDRFGIAIGFYTLGSAEYLELIAHGLDIISDQDSQWKQKALNYATQKGSRNARIAKEFVNLYRGKLV